MERASRDERAASVNRGSVGRYGLDWTRWPRTGSPAASNRNSAQLWTTRGGSQAWREASRPTAERFDVDGLRLIGDPNASGGLDDWTIRDGPARAVACAPV
jgi:hypothetical protein